MTHADSLGRVAFPVVGNISYDKLISETMFRCVIAKKLNVTCTEHMFFNTLSKVPIGDIKEWINKEKNCCLTVTKSVLRTLRSLIQLPKTQDGSKVFVDALDQLLDFCRTESITSVSVLFFRAKVESISCSVAAEGAKEIESLLYILKQDIQNVLSNIKSLEQYSFGSHTANNIKKRKEVQIN